MIKGKSGKADLTPSTRFQVKYLGCGKTGEPGVAGIEKAVRKILEQVKEDEKNCPKMYLEVGTDGVKFTEVKSKSTMKESKVISLENISYCTLNRIDATIFAFNHHQGLSVVECHALACDSEERAKAIGLAFYAAFREGHFQKLRRDRRKSFEQKHFERRKSFDNYDRNTSTNTNTEKSSLNVAEDSSNEDNSTNDDGHFEPCRDNSEVDIYGNYEEQDLELDKIIEDLLSTVELERAKIEQDVNSKG